MKWIKNMKIRQKLLSAFLLVSLFIAAVDFISISSMQRIKYNSESVYANNLVSIHDLDVLNENILDIRSSILTIINTNFDEDNIYRTLNRIEYLDRVNKALMSKYERTKSTNHEKDIYSNFKQEYESYIAERNEIIKLIQKGNFEEAKIEVQKASKIKDSVFKSLDTLISINMNNAMQSNIRSDEVYNRVSLAIKLLMVAELFTAVFLGIYISKYMSTQLEKELKFAEELAEGNLNGVIDIDTKDEFGVLSKKLNKAAENTLELIEELTAKEEELREQMSELQNMHEKLMLSEERYRLAIDGANDGIWDADFVNNKIFVSDRCKEIMGLQSKGNNYNLDYWLTMVFGYDREYIMNKITENFEENTSFYSFEFPVCTPFGEYKYVLCRGKAIKSKKGYVSHMAGSLTDITERKKAEEIISNMAYYSEITGLPNRTYVMKKLYNHVEDLAVNNKNFALFFLDMDNFKTVNDSYGHDVGDGFLSKAAELFKSCLKEGDEVCHLGGDEFIFLISSCEEAKEITEIAELILDIFKRPFNIKGHEILYVTASMGIAISPCDGRDLEELLKNADTAMYYAKNTGRNKFEFFNGHMNSEVVEKIKMKSELSNALINREFTVFYQPKVSAKEGTIVGVEALVRWQNPKEGLVSPGRFIPVAEETGLIVPIGEYVLRSACMQSKAWQESGKEPLRLAVNLSVKQLQRNDIVEGIKQVLQETGLEAKWLEIEITESVVMENFDRAIDVLSELKSMGIHISLDDFGTGYSSLNYLRKLPINAIKIDKSFIDGLQPGATENLIASSLINLAHGIGIRVVAEGVENIDQINILRSFNCDEIQGYFFSRPVNAKEFEKLIDNEQCQLVI